MKYLLYPLLLVSTICQGQLTTGIIESVNPASLLPIRGYGLPIATCAVDHHGLPCPGYGTLIINPGQFIIADGLVVDIKSSNVLDTIAPEKVWITATGDTIKLFKQKRAIYYDSTWLEYDAYVKPPVVIPPVVTPPPTIPPVLTTRKNIAFQSLGSESDAISKWPAKHSSTSYGITTATMGGRASIRFEVRKTDPIYAGGLRAELARYSDINKATYEVLYGISYYIPTDWVNDQSTLFDIVHQWHDNGYQTPTGDVPEYKSPFDFGIDGSTWQYQVRSGAGNVEKKFAIGMVEKGKWIDFVIHIKFVRTGSAGLVEIWKDGKLASSYAGAVGYDHYWAPYFKMGNYKWPWNPQDLACCGATNSKVHVLYISNFRLGTNAATVADVTPATTFLSWPQRYYNLNAVNLTHQFVMNKLDAEMPDGRREEYRN